MENILKDFLSLFQTTGIHWHCLVYMRKVSSGYIKNVSLLYLSRKIATFHGMSRPILGILFSRSSHFGPLNKCSVFSFHILDEKLYYNMHYTSQTRNFQFDL